VGELPAAEAEGWGVTVEEGDSAAVDALEDGVLAALESSPSAPQAVVRTPADNISTVRVSAEPRPPGRRRVRADCCADVCMIPFR